MHLHFKSLFLSETTSYKSSFDSIVVLLKKWLPSKNIPLPTGINFDPVLWKYSLHLSPQRSLPKTFPNRKFILDRSACITLRAFVLSNFFFFHSFSLAAKAGSISILALYAMRCASAASRRLSFSDCHSLICFSLYRGGLRFLPACGNSCGCVCLISLPLRGGEEDAWFWYNTDGTLLLGRWVIVE